MTKIVYVRRIANVLLPELLFIKFKKYPPTANLVTTASLYQIHKIPTKSHVRLGKQGGIIMITLPWLKPHYRLVNESKSHKKLMVIMFSSFF